MRKIFLLFLGVFFLCTGIVQASNITTIYDGKGSGTGWAGAQEDNEVEPGMIQDQSWDLEGFFLNGNTLSLVGGYNFKTGNSTYTSGDIFISTNGAPKVQNYAGNYSIVDNDYGYNYVIDLNWGDTNTYNVYAITKTSHVITAYYLQNQGSSPWQYKHDDHNSEDSLVASGTIGYDPYTGGLFSGWNGNDTHNELQVDLGFLPVDVGFYVHYTMGCGNDNIMGQYIPNPEPATMLLLGFGLIGLAGLGRRKIS